MKKNSRPKDISSILLENHQRFLSFLKSRVESAEAAEEILQGAYVKGLNRVGSLKDKEKLMAWFYQLLRNALTDYYRHKGVERKAIETMASETEHRREAVDRDLQRTVCKCVTQIINTLKPEYSSVLKKAELEDQSVKDLAAREKTTPTNVSVRLHRARRHLKEKLLQTCGNCASHGCTDCSCRHPL